MTENAVRDRETSTAAAWLMRGRPEPIRLAADVPVAGEQARELAPAPAPESTSVTQRDWSSALDLIHEATAAIRISEERSVELEGELERTVAQALDRAQFLENKVAAAESRAEMAEKRASEAEEWLSRLHDAVVAGFTRKAT